MSFLKHFSANAGDSINRARDLAGEYQHALLEPEHLMLAVLEQEDALAREVLQRAGVDPDEVELFVLENIASLEEEKDEEETEPPDQELEFSQRMIRVLEYAVREMESFEHQKLGTVHLLIAALEESSGVIASLRKSMEIDSENLEESFSEYLDKLTGQESKQSDQKVPSYL